MRTPRRRTKANALGLEAEKGRTLRTDWPGDLSGPTGSVLAVLILAAMWSDEFPGGWVTAEAFIRSGAFVRRTGEDWRSLRSTIRRAVRECQRRFVGVTTEHRRVRVDASHSVPRAHARRLRPPLSTSLQHWLLGPGFQCIAPEVRERFHATRHPSPASAVELLNSVEESVLRSLLDQGRHDEAVARARRALGTDLSEMSRLQVQLGLVTTLLRRGAPSDWEEARRLLEGLLAAELSGTNEHTLLLARVHISYAYAHLYLDDAVGMSFSQVDAYLEQLEPHVEWAEAAVGLLSLSDRAQITNLRGLIARRRALAAKQAAHRAELFALAEWHALEALAYWRMARDVFGIGAALYNLGELRYRRDRLGHGHASEAAVRDALFWYRASIRFGAAVGGQLSWVLDFCRAVECITLLRRFLTAQAAKEELSQLAAEAQSYLALAEAAAPPSGWQKQQVMRARMAYERAWLTGNP